MVNKRCSLTLLHRTKTRELLTLILIHVYHVFFRTGFRVFASIGSYLMHLRLLPNNQRYNAFT